LIQITEEDIEEEMMIEQLGEDYKKYKKRVAYRLIPFVY
jgi:protein-S-isoprenylcysteine O-methyltransferase Ste14